MSQPQFFLESRRTGYALASVETDFVNRVARVRYRPVDDKGNFVECVGSDVLYEHFTDVPIPIVPDAPRPPMAPGSEAEDGAQASFLAARAEFDRQMLVVRDTMKTAETAKASQFWTEWLADERPDAIKGPAFFKKKRGLP